MIRLSRPLRGLLLSVWLSLGVCSAALARIDCDLTPNAPICNPKLPANRWNPGGQLVSVTRVPGGLSISGWAKDPDVPNGPVPVLIEVEPLGGSLSSLTVQASQPRPAGGLAFTATVAPSAEGQVRVCATAVNVGRGLDDVAIGCQTVTYSHRPFGHLDSVQGGTFAVAAQGWATDPDVINPITVQFTRDGTLISSSLAFGQRNDVAAAYPPYGPNHGFTTLLPFAPTNGRHVICVTAVNAGAGSASGDLGCLAYTETMAPPAAPSDLSVSALQSTAGGPYSMLLAFRNNSPEAVRFALNVQPPGGAWMDSIDLPAKAGTVIYSHLLTGTFVPEQRYCYRVDAFTRFASSSSPVLCQAVPPQPPAAPDGLTVTVRDATSFNIAFNDNATNESGFVVYRTDTGVQPRVGLPTTVPAHPGTGQVTTVEGGLLRGHTYCHQVVAVRPDPANGGTVSSFGSNNACATLPAPMPPAAPSGLAVAARTASSLSLTWVDNSSNEAGFRLQAQVPGNPNWFNLPGADALPAGTTHFEIGNLSPGQAFCFRVIAFNADGDSAPSAALCTSTTGKANLVINGVGTTDVNDFSLRQDQPLAGQAFAVAWDECNNGQVAAPAHKSQLRSAAGIDEVQVQQTLAPGQCSLVGVPLKSGLPAGQYDTVIVVDSDNSVDELNEADNTLGFSFSVSP